MNLLDLLIIAVAVMAAIGGYRLGFVARAISWAGMILGIYLASLLLPPILRAMHPGDHRPQLFLVAVAVIIVLAFAGLVLGLLIGGRLLMGLRGRVTRRVDEVAGAIAGVIGVVVALWFLLPAMAAVPGWTAREARASVVAREIHGFLPAPPDTAQTLRRLVGDVYPDVFGALHAAPDLGPPPAGTGLGQQDAQRIARSTVKVVGQACRLIQSGSGFVVAPDLIATNAHVVAGERSTFVESSDGRRLDGTVVTFDPNRDLALIAVPGLGRPVLPRAAAAQGDAGGVFGHPEGGPLTVSPFKIGDITQAVGTDIYDRHRTERSVLILASQLAPGDSGGALVDPKGEVVGVAFAIAPDRPGVAYALNVSELEAVLAAPRGGAVSTGGCVAD
jgi:S1-C subfamily serine protease